MQGSDDGPAGRIWSAARLSAALSAGGVGLYAFATGRPVLRTTLPVTANCAVAFTTLAVAEEGVRALRGGESDAWGTLAAGALTGALLVGLRSGRPYALLGAVTWGPACAGGRVVLDWLQPGQVVRGFLVSQGLLDEPAPASPPPQRQRPWRDVREAREAAAAAAAAAAAEAQQAGGAQASRQGRQQQQQQQEQQRGWWWRRTRQLDPPTDPTFEPAEADLEFEQLTKRRQTQLINELKRREMAELNERLEAEAAARKAGRRQQQQQQQQQGGAAAA